MNCRYVTAKTDKSQKNPEGKYMFKVNNKVTKEIYHLHNRPSGNLPKINGLDGLSKLTLTKSNPSI